MNSFFLQFEEETCRRGRNRAVGLWFSFYRESVCLLSKFPAVRTVGSRRSKKQSRSTRRGLHVDTDLVEFLQLQELGVFSFSFIFGFKNRVNGLVDLRP